MTTQKQFKFWKDNRIDQEFTMTIDEMKPKFIEWMKTKEADWLAYYSAAVARIFITDKTGLSSVFEEKDLGSINKGLSEVKWEYLNTIGIK
jgi:hypothetical protein